MYRFPHQKEEVTSAVPNIKDSYENNISYMKVIYIENPNNYCMKHSSYTANSKKEKKERRQEERKT